MNRSAMSDSPMPTPRAIERVLRHAGLSRRQAKEMIAKGYRGAEALDDDLVDQVRRLAERLRSHLDTSPER